MPRRLEPRGVPRRIRVDALHVLEHGALAHEVGEFLDLHALLLDDPELLAGLDQLIRTGRYAADYAILLATAKLSDGGSQSYLNQAANTPVAKAQNCEAQGTLARPTCYKFFYGEIEAELAVQGQSIFDVEGHLVRPVREEWRPLLNTIDEIG